MKWYERILKRLGFHVHDLKMFLIGEFCVVKCTTCGMESMPWSVPKELADAARPHHLNDATEYLNTPKQDKGEG